MTNIKNRNIGKILTVLGIVLVFAIGFMLLGMFIDIQIILEYNHTPIPFTFILPFVGALVGLFLAFRTVKPKLPWPRVSQIQVSWPLQFIALLLDSGIAQFHLMTKIVKSHDNRLAVGAENIMYWFLVFALFFLIAIFLHLKSVEHTKLQEKYGKERGIKLGKTYATLSSSEFIFWIGLLILPQPMFIIPILSNSVISIAGVSIPIIHLIVSLPLIVVGAWLGIEGVRETGMELAETHCSPKKILNTGIYSRVRHPQYSGWILAHIGISILLSAWYSMLFTPVLIAFVYLISKKEEEELVKEFGEEYVSYRENVPMLIPSWKDAKI